MMLKRVYLRMPRLILALALTGACAGLSGVAPGQDAQTQKAPAEQARQTEQAKQTEPVAAITQLPTDHGYQKALIGWLGSLSEQDLTVEITPFRVEGMTTPTRSLDDLHRLWTLRLLRPPFDVGLPAKRFLLSEIQRGQAVVLPAISCSATAWITQWDDPMNPYLGNKALKRRALVWAAVDMMMLDRHHDSRQGRRSDFLGGTLIWLGYTYMVCKDVMPEEARVAFAQGLRRMFDKVMQWGPTGSMTDMDLFAPTGLWYAAKALDDPSLMQAAENYSRPLFTSPRFFHPAGYFVDVGAYDVSYNGISLYFAAHAAAVTQWDFVKSALDKAYDLRRYMVFPDPAGKRIGPSSYSPRTANCVAGEQWGRPIRHATAAMYGEAGLGLVPDLTEEELQATTQIVFDSMQDRNKPADRPSVAWKESHWSSDLPFAYDHYTPGLRERRRALSINNPEEIRWPFSRNQTFVRNFHNTLLAAKLPTFGVILHTGPIGRQTPTLLYGFSGGSLAGFWTPDAGPVILGRRSGSQGGAVPDSFKNWKLWPVHATSGSTPDGKAFSTARVQKPHAVYQTTENTAEVQVTGQIKNGDGADTREGGALKSPIDYTRTFNVDEQGLTIHTQLKSTEPQGVQELYEILPLYIGVLHRNFKSPIKKTQAHFDNQWHDLSNKPTVTQKIRVERAGGAIIIQLDKPRPVQLSETDWASEYQDKASTRNIMIGLLESSSKPGDFTDASVKYTISAESKQGR